MFGGDRCVGRPECGHTVNWTCPCTCWDDTDAWVVPRSEPEPILPSVPSVDALLRYVQHDAGCLANDLDPLDHSPCTCGLRKLHNPWGKPEISQ